MLTKKQRDLLLFISERIKQDSVAPSFDEMKDALGLKSKSGIHRLIRALEERGFIRKLPNRARALEVIRLPDQELNIQYSNQEVSSGNSGLAEPNSNVFKADFSKTDDVNNDPHMLEIPLHGRIAAGTPIEALEQFENIPVPVSMVGTGSHYALEIDGDSMIEAGILDGDTVIIQRCDVAPNGTIVVALIDDEEATLKTLRKRGMDIALEPSNAEYETQTYAANRVRIQGRLVGLLRQYH
jgi:repressor LexA